MKFDQSNNVMLWGVLLYRNLKKNDVNLIKQKPMDYSNLPKVPILFTATGNQFAKEDSRYEACKMNTTYLLRRNLNAPLGSQSSSTLNTYVQ